MPTTYSQISDIKRILNDVIRFSDSIYAIGRNNKNPGTIDFMLSGLTMDPNYAGFHIRFELRFTDMSDDKHYYIYRQISTEGAANMALIGDGYTNVDKILPNVMKIAAAGFIGSVNLTQLPNRYDVIEIETFSHISNVDAESIGNDIEYAIDNILRKNVVITTPEDPAAPALSGDIPRNIKIAHMYLWAYRLIDDMFKSTRSMDTNKGKSDPSDNYNIASGWYKTGTNALEEYIKTYNTTAGNAPRWIGVAPMIQTIGIAGVATVSTSKDVDYTESNNDVPGILDRNMEVNVPEDFE